MRARRRIAVIMAMAVMLGACDGLDGGTRPAPLRVSLSDRQVVIAGPAGFCIDPSATRSTGREAVALLGSCAAIANSPTKEAPGRPAILIAAVSPEDSDSPIAGAARQLDTFFRSEAGRAALSRAGKAGTVTVLETRQHRGAFLVHARDSANASLAGAGDDYWRALFDVKGRIVTASVIALKDKPLSSRDGRKLLEAFVARIRAENAGPS